MEFIESLDLSHSDFIIEWAYKKTVRFVVSTEIGEREVEFSL